MLLREIENMTGIPMPNISKKAKKDSWVKYSPSSESIDLPKAIASDAKISHEPNDKVRKQVSTMAAYGLIDEEIASICGINTDELKKIYAHELSSASPAMVAQVAQSLFKMATDC